MKKKKLSFSKICIHLFLLFSALLFIVPMVLVLIVSFTSEESIGRYGYSFFPKAWSAAAYERMLYPGSPLFQSYAVTILTTLAGTFIAVIITYMAAYPLANRQIKYRNGFALYFFITSVFNSGLVPWYMICKALHMYNNLWALVIPSMIFTPFNLFLVRNYIKSMPASLMESARLDGAGEGCIAFRIYFPLCKPVLATITLFYGIGYWNNWFNAVMLLDNARLYPLQMLLFRLQSDIKMLSMLSTAGMVMTNPPTESFKMATVIITIGPVILLYPFLQRYFVKGIMIGAVKG